MNNFKSPLFYLLILLFSCSTAKKAIEPEWIFKNYDTHTEIYGSGIAFTFQEAKKMALQNISSKIVTIISSKSTLQSATTKVASRLEYRSLIKEKNKDLIIHNFEVVKQQEFEKKFYLLLKVSKKTIYKTYEQKLANQFKEFGEIFKQANQEKVFYKKQSQLKKILDKKEQVKGELLILKGLDQSFNSQKYLEQLAIYKNSYDEIIRNIRVVISSKLKSPVVEEIKKYLLDNSVIIKKTTEPFKNNFFMTFNIQETKDFVLNHYFRKYKLVVNLLDDKKQLYKTLDINFSGSSYLNYQNALNKALSNFRKYLNQKRIVENLLY